MPVTFGITDSREDFTYAQSVRMAKAAYSTRLLSTAYTGNCMIVRRSSDSAELTVGFVSGMIDLASIESWAGADTVYVKTWFDQSGTGNDITQATGASQPVLYNAGALETINAKPAIYFDGATHLLRDANFVENVPYNFLTVSTCQDTGASRWIIGTNPGTNNNGLQIGYNSTNGFKIAQWNNDANFTPTWSINTPYTHAGGRRTVAGSSLLQNSVLISNNDTLPSATFLSNATNFYVGGGGSPSFLLGHIGEVVVWTYPISRSQLVINSNDAKTYFAT